MHALVLLVLTGGFSPGPGTSSGTGGGSGGITVLQAQEATGWRADGGSTAAYPDTLRVEVGGGGIATDGGVEAWGAITARGGVNFPIGTGISWNSDVSAKIMYYHTLNARVELLTQFYALQDIFTGANFQGVHHYATGGFWSTYPSGNDAVSILNGAYINLSTADTNSRLYRSAVDTIKTDGNLEVAGTLTGAVNTVEEEGTPLTRRTALNFTGSAITCSDSGGKTVCSVSSGSGNFGTFTSTFGDGALSTYFSDAVVVSAAWVGTSSSIMLTPKCVTTVGTNTPENCLAAQISCTVTAISAATSFTAICNSPVTAHGGYTISYTGG